MLPSCSLAQTNLPSLGNTEPTNPSSYVEHAFGPGHTALPAA